MGFHDYNRLQSSAFCVVSDSGTLPEESSFFASVGMPFPAVCIRTSTERPEALDKACFTLAGINERGLVNAVRTAVALDGEGSLPQAPVIMRDETVSTKVIKIVQSYTGVVDKMVWRKDVRRSDFNTMISRGAAHFQAGTCSLLALDIVATYLAYYVAFSGQVGFNLFESTSRAFFELGVLGLVNVICFASCHVYRVLWGALWCARRFHRGRRIHAGGFN